MTLPQFRTPKTGDTVATLHTTKGDIKFLLFPEAAPKTVENFTTHAKNGYYDNVIFHRVIPNFMIQTGDPEGTGRGGESIYGGSFEDEFDPLYRNFNGALCMANAGPNTNGSQFFIVQLDEISDDVLGQMERAGEENGYFSEVIDAYREHGGAYWLDFKHSVFGQVIEGFDNVVTIAEVERNRMDKPLEDVLINNITVETIN